MAASDFTLEAVKNFMIENNCKVTNHELVTKFKSYLNDHENKTQNREKFKEFVNTLAGIKIDERGEKVLVLKKKYKPENNVELRQDRAASEPPKDQNTTTDIVDGGGMSKVHSDGNIHGGSQDNISAGAVSVSSSVSSVVSTTSEQMADDDVNASIVSVKERALHLNRIESESELMKMPTSPRKKEHRSTKDGDYDEDSQSSGSGFVSLDVEERDWIVTSASAEYHPIHKMLTRNPSLVHVKDFTSGYTALHWAAKHGKPEVIKLLASQQGVNVNKRTNGGYTALHLAAMHGHEDIIELLVQTYKADPNLRDYSGKKAKQYLRNTASTKAQRLFGHDINIIAMGELLLSRKLGSTIGSGRSLDDSFTRSASFRRSKQVKAISSLIHGSSSQVRAMFRTTWAGSAEDLQKHGHTAHPRSSRSRSPSSTPPGSGKASPVVHRRETYVSRSVDRELMPPPTAPMRKRREGHSASQENLSNEEMQRTISEPTLSSQRQGPKTYI